MMVIEVQFWESAENILAVLFSVGLLGTIIPGMLIIGIITDPEYLIDKSYYREEIKHLLKIMIWFIVVTVFCGVVWGEVKFNKLSETPVSELKNLEK